MNPELSPASSENLLAPRAPCCFIPTASSCRSHHARHRPSSLPVCRRCPYPEPATATEAQWFAENKPFANPSQLFLQPDHYLFRMLYSQGVSMDSMGIPKRQASQGAKPHDTPAPDRGRPGVFSRPTITSSVEHPAASGSTMPLQSCSDRQASLRRHGRPLLRCHRRETSHAGFFAACTVSALRLEVLATTDAAISQLIHHKALRKTVAGTVASYRRFARMQ